MKIIALSGCPAALPSLKYFYSKHQLSALLCPTESTGFESQELEKWARFREIPCWQVSQQQEVKVNYARRSGRINYRR